MSVRISEEDFSQQVVDYARLKSWKVARWPTWRPTGTYPGVPDLVCAKEGRVVFLELKAARGELSEAQREWIVALLGHEWLYSGSAREKHGSYTVAVVYPEDWSLIEELLG